MSFQAYLDNIKVLTGKTKEDFKMLADKKGLLKEGVKAGAIVAWLKEDFNLGHGHAMAVYATLKDDRSEAGTSKNALTKHFAGSKSIWQPVFDSLMERLQKIGADIAVNPANTYLSIVRGNKKMALVQITAGRMDIGLKLKGVAPTARFEPAGSWNTMMTHRVLITAAKQIDKELLNWLQSAYEQNG